MTQSRSLHRSAADRRATGSFFTMKNLYHHSSFDRVADIAPLVKEMQEYAHRVLVETSDPFGSCYGVQYKFTVFRIMIGGSLLSYYTNHYELERLFKETLNETRQKLNGARVFDVAVVIHDNPAEFDRVLEVRVKHSEIPQVVLVGADLSTNGRATAKVPAAQVPAFEAPACTEKPSRLITD